MASFFITFREVLEAALVVVIVLAYLRKAGEERHYVNVWLGLASGAAASVALAFVFEVALGGFTGHAEMVFEGVMMLVAAVLLTWMIFWMMTRSHAAELNSRLDAAVASGGVLGITALVAVAVLREGVEMVIFLEALGAAGGADALWAIAGGTAAAAVGYLAFRGSRLVKIGTLFRVSSIVLVLFAAGLASHAVHEFEEAGLIASWGPVYDITWLISKKDMAGGVLNSLFGYTGRPSTPELAAYLGYLFVVSIVYIYARRPRVA